MDAFVGYVLSAALTILAATIGVCAWFIKQWMARIEKSILEYGKAQQDCQLSLAKTYRTKSEAEADSIRQWIKIDDHGTRLTRIETLMTGDGK